MQRSHNLIARYYVLQIDLFKSRKYTAECLKNSKKVEIRKFSLEANLDHLDKEFPYTDKMVLDDYKHHLLALAEKGRQYTYVGQCGSDNLYELETLGVGKYCKEYTVIIDFSNALDYILHRSFGCNLNDIHKIKQYMHVSQSMLNYDFSKTADMNFGILFDISPELNEHLATYLKQAEESNIGVDARMPTVVYRFYTEILSNLSSVKDYVITYLHAKQPKGSFVYRSKNFSSVLASSDYPIEETLELVQDGFETYTVKAHSYRQFEYARERMVL